MKRIVVVGPPCSGKTTTAAAIAERLGIQHVELDALWWDAGWTEAGAERFKERLAPLVGHPSWVMDGNYLSVGALEVIQPRADTIVWLDEGRWTTVPRGIRRTIGRIMLRKELWSGNREPLRYLIRPGWIVNAIRRHPDYNREAERLIGSPSTAHVTWVRLRGRRAITGWLESLSRTTPGPMTPGRLGRLSSERAFGRRAHPDW